MENPPGVPYQAYRSKRHSRTLSTLPLAPNVPAPAMSRPSNVISNGSISIAPAQSEYSQTEKVSVEYPAVVALLQNKTPFVDMPRLNHRLIPRPVITSLPPQNPNPPPTNLQTSTERTRKPNLPPPVTSPSSSSSPLPPPKQPSSSTSTTTPKKTSTYRRIQLHPSAARSPLPSSPLRPPGAQSRVPSTSSSVTRQFDQSPKTPRSPPLHSRVTSISSVISEDKPYTVNNINDSIGPSPSYTPDTATRCLPSPAPPVPQLQLGPGARQPPPRSSSMLVSPQPPPKSGSPASTSLSASPSTSPSVSNPSLPSVATRSSAHYIPGFQPRGFYRHRTDEFCAARKAKNDTNRIERTKLERRLEKLINLHFPIEGSELKEARKAATEHRRSSTLFDLDLASLRKMDAGEIWKGMLQSQALQGAKGDIRAAEQRITPWQEDSTVSKCPLCNASFHPLTNRKHHCRLCGQIICSLPIKHPQRPEPCSILFIVDSKTRRIEEVGEGVDYGVKRRGSGMATGKGNGKGKEKARDDTLADDEKFLKGVRALINLEEEIEASLPQFQELLLTLNSDSQPTKEASAARKRILEDFASYDALSKRIRSIPCTPGSSQDHVQVAIHTRANLFLQKNMFPLQSLPKPKKHPAASSDAVPPLVDPDSDLAHALQPLLEQEALLESFVGEAMAHRKFEDVKTLKANLKEIRVEIDRMLENGSGSRSRNGHGRAVGG
ncbi:FYVE-domain-containing protein [Melanogaster broomeanus]|nr:FYVE-domain-containing protein [Melanogaster broomeanus]